MVFSSSSINFNIWLIFFFCVFKINDSSNVTITNFSDTLLLRCYKHTLILRTPHMICVRVCAIWLIIFIIRITTLRNIKINHSFLERNYKNVVVSTWQIRSIVICRCVEIFLKISLLSLWFIDRRFFFLPFTLYYIIIVLVFVMIMKLFHQKSCYD